MSPIQSLPPDQQAVLGLLLKQGKTYDDVGTMLRIDRESVRWRAHQAVNALAPPEPDAPIEGRHWQTVDYLLGQQTASERAQTRELLETSADERAWARSMAAELRPMAGENLPEIPADPAEVDQAFEALDERTAAEQEGEKKSRLGNLLLLGGLGVLVAVALVLILSSGGSNKDNALVVTPPATKTQPKTGTGTTTTPPKTTTTTAASTSTAPPSTPATTPKPALKGIAQINLAVPGGKSKSPFGVAEVLGQNGSLVANIVGQGLAPSGHQFAYAVWLTGPNTTAHFVGFTPTVKADGKLRVLAPLPKNVGTYKTLEITKETTSTPQQPGTVVLTGAIPHLSP